MGERARALARGERILPARGGNSLQQRLADAEAALDAAFQAAHAAVGGENPVEPAAEWLLDNFYVIKEQIKEIRAGLPRAYWRELPTLVSAEGERGPRVLHAMRELLADIGGNVSVGDVKEFVAAYQETSRFTLGELWAMPLMLRLALLQRLKPLADSVVQRLRDNADAATWAERVLAMAQRDPGNLVLVVADMARARPSLSPAWVSEFQRRMRGGSPALGVALAWLEQQLAAQHRSVASQMERQSRHLAAAQVAISGCIGSMRRIARSDWSDVVESLSVVEATLRDDPADVYAAMDFATRDRYRHAVEEVARHGGGTEWDVAARAITMAQAMPAGDTRRHHVGYWLVGSGRLTLERASGARAPWRLRWLRWRRRLPLTGYLIEVGALTLAFAVLGLPGLREFTALHAVLMGVALLVAATHVAVAIVNWLTTLSMPPMRLPRLALEEGIPDAWRTLVAVPCLLGSGSEIANLVAALEIRQLANRDDNLYFALLADFPDAVAEEMPGDAALVRAAVDAIDALNARHASHGGARFALFLRPRRWNPNERTWMGHERKRGKIADLNRYLRGNDEAMQLRVGDRDVLRGCRCVLVLDADTELPPLAAVRLVATLAHPLNQPRVDAASHRVVEGYGILQPRISVGPGSESASSYARLYSEEIGLDPYTHAVSDVYQDLFGEASFVGKGLYDIDAFAATTGARFPDNLILSHDLLEGSYARTGLVSDVEFFERQPDRYTTDMRRRHRWIRGDWQILPWLAPWVPGPRSRWLRNPLTAAQRWKILDNLRRSVVPLALLLLFIDGWLLSHRPAYWTLIGLGVAFVSPLLISLRYLIARNPRMEWSVHFRLHGEGTLLRLKQTALFIAMLPYEALHYADAIGRALWRMFISRRRLLQWTPASVAAKHAARSLGENYRLMLTAPLVSALIAFGMLAAERGLVAWLVAAPLLILWALSPWLAWRISQPRHVGDEAVLGAGERAFLGIVARRTWRYFDHFVSAASHHLPPDNHQEFPADITARRTSPTNIGMYLASALSAWDFGYLTTPDLLARVGATLDTLGGLQRYRGHFLNWYDIDTLEPLAPRYVSTVDSGNLIACLLVVARGLDMLAETRLVPPQMWRGLGDTWRVFVQAASPDASAQAPVAALLATPPADAASAQAALTALTTALQPMEPAGDAGEARYWWQQLDALVRTWLTDLAPVAAACAATAPADDARAAAVVSRLAENLPRRNVVRLVHGLTRSESGTEGAWREPLTTLVAALDAHHNAARQLAARCRDLAAADFECLIHPSKSLLSIGYDVDRHTLDEGAYDLLASEARLTVFVAIAQGRLARKFWFSLGRLLTVAAGRPALVSWSGSMFEYLMPRLLMPGFDNTLMGRSVRAVVARQISYGRERGVPWGISESGYNVTDQHMVYQYRAFGVPGLGLKRGLGDDLVIAPYAAGLATMVEPVAAARNLRRLAELGALGDYGFHEALDYTPARVPGDAPFALVKSYMAHHQGMLLTALSAALNGQPLQRRFLREPMFRANQILLQEKVPAALSIDADTLRAEETLRPQSPAVAASILSRLDTRVPQVQLLSNGRYHVVVSQAGGGYSQFGDVAVNPWRADAVRDAGGVFCYIQDLDRDLVWSNAWLPVAQGRDYHASFTQASVEFLRQDHGIETHTRIAVSSEDDVELRRITLANRSGTRRHLAVCSYLDWALVPMRDYVAHPAFNQLFVETEYVPEVQAVLARRRARSASEEPPVFVHVLGSPRGVGPVSCETRRDIFLGRAGDVARPVALTGGQALGNHTGAVLDPMAALRRELVLEPGASASFDLVVGVAPDRDRALALAARYADRRHGSRVFDLAWTREQVVAHQLNLGAGDRKLFAHLASSVLYPDSGWRAAHNVAEPRGGQSGLWKFAISGDLPIVIVRARALTDMSLVRQALQAHVYWRMHGLKVDLMIWNEEAGGYRQELNDRIMGLIGASVEANVVDRPGGVFVRRVEHLGPDDRVLLLATARLVLDGARGSISEQVPGLPAAVEWPRKLRVAEPSPPLELAETLQLDNGIGGYSADGTEYVVRVVPDRLPPRPWCNVLANPDFGTVVSERGAAYSFAVNAREFRLTPWHNDALVDDCGEAFYIRDDDRDVFWSPTPWPVPGGAGITRHGFGYTCHTLQRAGISSTQTQFVASAAPLKLTLLELVNDSRQTRHLSVYGYVEWVLGEQRAAGAPYIRTAGHEDGTVVFAHNAWHDAFAARVAFFASDAAVASSGDRAAFIGRNRSLTDPAALRSDLLNGNFGAGIDPCAALQQQVTLAPGARVALVFLLGAADSDSAARHLAAEFADVDVAREELDKVKTAWRARLGTFHVTTPDTATNLLVNGWLAYQVIASRLWARSGFYQSGGAYGFRDQLQDAMALLAFDSGFARDQILRCAAHQFAAGDVQHWWHPPHNRGVRTRFSDDYLWLPWAVAQYVAATGDAALLDVEVPFLEGRELGPGEESWYDFAEAGAGGSVYEHARRALLHGLRFGVHGLPLIGCGDWNDGMNRLGAEGRGESVWLGFFLIDVLHRFAAVATARDDAVLARRCEDEARMLAGRLEEHAWDGEWYRRAWADDGTVVGSADSVDCRIDSLPQSWATLTATGDPERRGQALDAVRLRLLHEPERVLQLFDPPFDKGELDPGYIKGYVPGTRENGGQYTHAAVWYGMALAAAGRVDAAWGLWHVLNPIEHARDAAGVATYQVEPYVVTADVYWAEAWRGRGGWSWYTGSAGWMLRFALESLLGLAVRPGALRIAPRLPADWNHCAVQYHRDAMTLTIDVERGAPSDAGLWLDGAQVDSEWLTLPTDTATHAVRCVIPR